MASVIVLLTSCLGNEPVEPKKKDYSQLQPSKPFSSAAPMESLPKEAPILEEQQTMEKGYDHIQNKNSGRNETNFAFVEIDGSNVPAYAERRISCGNGLPAFRVLGNFDKITSRPGVNINSPKLPIKDTVSPRTVLPANTELGEAKCYTGEQIFPFVFEYHMFKDPVHFH